jgi:hypothetical protein
MLGQPAADLKQILIAELAALNDNEVRHRSWAYPGVGCESRKQ